MFIVKYDACNNYTNLGLFLKNEIGIDFQYDFTDYSKTNVSKTENINYVLDTTSIERLQTIYSEDIEIYSRFNNSILPYFRLG
jgi:hypothetical protein